MDELHGGDSHGTTAPPPPRKAVLAANVAIQQKAKADIHLLAPGDVQARFPWLNCDGIAAASYGRSGEGWMDPVSWMTLLRKGAAARGVEFLKGEVEAVEVGTDGVKAITLAGGTRITGGAFVNAVLAEALRACCAGAPAADAAH